ncbi:hypothetical protein P3X46_001055 [Hevea brasiliensis]|uniref:DUF761 domain-containing protein n=1 Tax=Hevea brasiliensis TaxID=3981 RepID=A0ABQ9NC45_HEVBR|nr:uncharacterized protein LOC110639846 [Hevea brasiliensis]KAJ9189802.1 hypothetical protein P3X46_001055 [Hevea brasiliensis]
MEVHPRVNSMLAAKRLWNVLRLTFFMIRKGLVSKRKLIMDMNLMVKRGKLLRKSFSNLICHHHHHHHGNMASGSYGLEEYEFSCSNSPNPVFFHLPKRKHHYFPCINPPEVIEEEEETNKAAALVMVPKTPDEYPFNLFHHLDASDFAPEEKRSPLPSPLSVRVSNYSSEDENDSGINGEVDDEAEEFIRRFYEQLRLQSRMQLLEYQDRK